MLERKKKPKLAYDPEQLKWCSLCSRWLPSKEFTPVSKKDPRRRAAYCRPCSSLYKVYQAALLEDTETLRAKVLREELVLDIKKTALAEKEKDS